MKNKLIYALVSLFISIIGVPVIMQYMAFVLITFLTNYLPFRDSVLFPFVIVVCLAFVVWTGRCVAWIIRLPDEFLWRYGILFIPMIVALALWIVSLFISQYQLSESFMKVFVLGLLPWFFSNLFFMTIGWWWCLIIIPVTTQLSFILGIYWGARRYHAPLKQMTGLTMVSEVIGMLLIAVVGQTGLWLWSEHYFTENKDWSVNEHSYVSRYRPGTLYNRLTIADGASAIDRWYS